MPNSKDTHPIVGAVLADPVVKAVLKDPSAATTEAVEAVSSGTDTKVPEPPEPHPAPPMETATPITTSKGTTTTSQTAGVMTSASGQLVAAPTSTEEEDRGTAGQRAVNLLWENTQAKIAIAVVYCGLIVAAVLSLTAMLPWATEKQVALAITAFMLLSSLSTLVIGFYYGRTNHQKIGGIAQGR